MKAPELNFPGPGLIRTTPPETAKIDSSQRAALIRRGNELFNAGEIEQAKKIFLSTSYRDGLLRVGDYYYKQNDFLSALQMYVIAPDSEKKEYLIERLARVVQEWLTESNFIDKSVK